MNASVTASATTPPLPPFTLDRVAIVMMSAVGDAVHVMPIIHAIKAHAPASRITWVLQPGPATLVRGHPLVDDIVLFDRTQGWKGFLKTRRELASRQFDVVLALQVYFKAGVITGFTHAPVKLGFDRERAHELAITPLRPWDLAVDVHGRKPLRPFDSAGQLVDGCSRMFHAMGSGMGEMFDTLKTGDCLDLDSRSGKAPGGYQYQRQYTRQPFIFMNAAGMHRDLVTMVHEAGHAFHSILSKDDPLLDYRNSPTEFAEVASMSMELLTLPYHHEFYSQDECKRALRERLERFPTIMTWIATIDAFQHWIYTNPAHTRAQRTDAWRSLMTRFGNDVSWEGCEEARDAAWQRQLHLFGMPFYYIEYGIAETGAIQMWIQSRRNQSQALANYRKGLALGGSRPLPELFATAGLRFELSSSLMSELAREVDKELVAR